MLEYVMAILIQLGSMGQMSNNDLNPKKEEPFIVQKLDTISVVHVKDGAELVFFFDFIQGEWSVLDHRWLAADMITNITNDGKFTLYWRDDGDSCYRLMVADHYYETWVEESPLAIQHNRPWFARLLAPGLRGGK